MTKIVYVLTEGFFDKPIKEVARMQGVEVIPELIRYEEPDSVFEEKVHQWEAEGVEIILCRGMMEARLKKIATTAFVMGVYFSSESTISILWNYQKDHPEFFGPEKKKVLCFSSHPLSLDEELISELFNVELENIPLLMRPMNEELIEYAKTADLVIAGNRYTEMLRSHGANAYFYVIPEVQTLHHNFRLADVIASSRREMREKNEEIQNLLDNSFNAVLTLDLDGNIHNANGQLKRHFKRDMHEILGKSIYEFIPGFRPELIERAKEKKSGFYGELVEFDQRILVMNGFPLYSKGEISGVGLHFEELKQIEKVEQKVRTELYNKGLVAKYHFDDIVGQSRSIYLAKEYGKSFAKHSANVLLYGESGTGKELFAQSIHNYSSRKDAPFVAINCGALPPNLLESELFGYVGGAFTGASKNGKKGFLELANKGTIFLDEISEMDMMGQVRLLRVLEERVITRVGDDKVIPVNLRIIAASNKNLKKLVEEGKFREDLYYRLNVLMLRIPPLRERKEDIPILTEQFLRQFGELNKKQVELDAQARKIIADYPWKGNVRQLRNFCERLVIISNRRVIGGRFVVRQLNDSYFETLVLDEMDPDEKCLQNQTEIEKDDAVTETLLDRAERKKESELCGTDEKERILEALNQACGKRDQAAELLGISKTSLWRKMKKYNISEKY